MLGEAILPPFVGMLLSVLLTQQLQKRRCYDSYQLALVHSPFQERDNNGEPDDIFQSLREFNTSIHAYL
jgi:hypothetical protein